MKNDALVGMIKCTIEGISRTKAAAMSKSLFYLLLAFQEGIQGGTICFFDQACHHLRCLGDIAGFHAKTPLCLIQVFLSGS